MHRYYLINRPPFIGTHPQGAIDKKVWSPVQRIPTQPSDCDRYAHGFVDYAAPLTEAEIEKWELYPGDTEERENTDLWAGR